MTTVFNLEYLENLRRVKSSADMNANGRHDLERVHANDSSTKLGRDFGKTLLEVEENAKKPSNSRQFIETTIQPNTEDQAKGSIQISSPEARQSGSLLLAALGNNLAITGDKCLTPNLELSSEIGVNNLSRSVNLPTPKLDPNLNIIDNLNTPEEPEILQAQRVLLDPEAQLPESVDIISAKAIARGPKYATREYKEQILSQIISTAGRYHGIEHELGMAIAKVESDLNPRAVSKDGHASKGIFQLLDSTGKGMKKITGMNDPYDPFDPAQNAYLGLAYLKRLHNIFSEETILSASTKTIPVKSTSNLEKFSIAAYNAGEGNVARAQARARSLGKDPQNYAQVEPFIPSSTREYVKKVLRLRENLLAANQSQLNTKDTA